MNAEPRDTQFATFAELLFEDLGWEGVWIDTINSYWKEEWKENIARRAYDLVRHTIENTGHSDLDMLTTDEHVRRIPDMMEWPDGTR